MFLQNAQKFTVSNTFNAKDTKRWYIHNLEIDPKQKKASFISANRIELISTLYNISNTVIDVA